MSFNATILQALIAAVESYDTVPTCIYGTVQIRFFVGHSKTGTTDPERAAHAEQQKHGDIVALDVPDTYVDLIEKVRQSFLWAAQNTVSEYVLKVDDDAYVNVPLMMETINDLPTSRLYATTLSTLELPPSTFLFFNLPEDTDWVHMAPTPVCMSRVGSKLPRLWNLC